MSNDLRYAIRMLRKSPGFAITAVLTLGLAIGANAAVFSVVDAVLFKSLPFPAPDRLALVTRVSVRGGVAVGEDTSHTGAVWEAIRDHATTVDPALFSGLSARVNLVTGDRALLVLPHRVSAGYFRVLGVGPAIGREFLSDEDRAGGSAVAILSDRLWRSAFNADPAVVGRTVLLKGEPQTVVGIMPATFRSNVDADIWTPIRGSRTGEGGGDNFGIVVRLKDGASWAQAASEMASIGDAALTRRTLDNGATRTHSLTTLQQGLTQGLRQPLMMLWGAVVLVLVVACVNLAGLQLARGGQRGREIATRLAIGGDRRNVMRQLLIENIVLTIVGGVAGLVVGAIALEGLERLAGDIFTTAAAVSLDGRVLALAAGMTFLTALGFGVLPAFQATRVNVQAALQAGSTRSVAAGPGGWTRKLLVATEVALGVVLLVGAGLLLRTFVHLQTLSPGFDPHNLVTTSASLEDARYATSDRIARLFDDSVARLRALPGVANAAVSLGLPYQRILNMGAQIVGDGQPAGDVRISSLTYVTPGYFETLDLPVTRGRALEAHDESDSAPVMVVNESFARRYLATRDPIAQHVRIANRVFEIVGVAANVPQRGGFNSFGPIDELPIMYVPFAKFPDGGLRVFHTWFAPAWIIRTATPGGVSEQAIRQAIASIDPQLPTTPIAPIDAQRSASLAPQRLLMVLVGVLAVSALLLAAIGIHGLIASGVAERTRELGIRLALGSTVAQAICTVALPGIVLTVVGLVVGSALAFGAAGLIRSLLWGVQATDPLTFAGVAVTLLLVSVVASVAPALRVRRLDPVSLLRE
jgi:predicted permease